MDRQVETHEFDESLVITKAKESRQVVRIILLEVDRRELAIAENVAVNATSNVRELGDPVISLYTKVTTKTRVGTHRSMQSSKTGPQYSRLLIPSE